MRPMAKNIVENLDLILRDAIDSAHGKGQATGSNVVTLDNAAAEALQEIHDALTKDDRKLDEDTRAQMFKIMNLSERLSWLLSHLPVDQFAKLEKA